MQVIDTTSLARRRDDIRRLHAELTERRTELLRRADEALVAHRAADNVVAKFASAMSMRAIQRDSEALTVEIERANLEFAELLSDERRAGKHAGEAQ